MKQNETMIHYVLRLALTLLLITGLMAAVLAGINQLTSPRIEAARAAKTVEALSAVLPDAETAQQITDYPDDTGLVTEVYESEQGYALKVTPTGFDNTITMMVGVDRSGSVLGVSIISHTETPGLGAVSADKTPKGEAFRDQFIGMSGELAVSKDGGSVDALTGATITSRAVTAGVNAALACVAGME